MMSPACAAQQYIHTTANVAKDFMSRPHHGSCCSHCRVARGCRPCSHIKCVCQNSSVSSISAGH
eukprot:scaffold342992_cov29-Prasinocladus_malaysianus.AAC.1